MKSHIDRRSLPGLARQSRHVHFTLLLALLPMLPLAAVEPSGTWTSCFNGTQCSGMCVDRADGSVYAVVEGKGIHKSVDHGKTFTLVDSTIVKSHAETLSRKVSSDDKAKLDEYLTSVREVEKRVESMRKTKDQSDELAQQKNRPAFTMDRPQNGLPEDLRDHARLMCDIIAIAFQTDKTRVASLIVSRDLLRPAHQIDL